MKTLSLVVPVYNAPGLARALVARIPELRETARSQGFELVETILVDDGSSCALSCGPDGVQDAGVPLRILRNERNRGKGYAVRRGALEARGDWVLMSDVDLSTPFTEFARLAVRADDAWMVCGSRHGRPGMPWRRRILSRVFQSLVRLAGIRGVHDTQCGFKLFRMDEMRRIFEIQRIERFSFDVELVRLVQLAGGSVAEVPVTWRGGARSSLRVLRDAPRMLYDLFRIR